MRSIFVRVLSTCAAIVVTSLLVLSAFYFLDERVDLPAEYAVRQVAYNTQHQPNPPSEDAGWTTIELPGGPRALPAAEPPYTAWYRFRVDDSVRDYDGPLVFYQFSPLANVEFFAGQRRLGSGGPMREPLPFHARQVMFEFDSPVIRNETWLYHRTGRMFSAPRAVQTYVGPKDRFVDTYAHVRLWGFHIPMFIVAVMLTLGVLLLLLWVFRRREAAFGLYGLTICLWAFHILHGLVLTPPVSAEFWFVLDYLSLWWVLLMPLFVHRFFSVRRPRTERAILVSGVAGTLLLSWATLFASFDTLAALSNLVWVPFTQLWGLYALCVFAGMAWVRGGFENVMLFVLGGLMFVVGTRDILFLVGADVPGLTFYVQYVAAAQMLFIVVLLARRFVSSLGQYESLNVELEERIARKSEELEDNYRRLNKLERAETLATERQRLMRDVHDGLGGQLVQALVLSERDGASEELRTALDAALQDLRMIVDSLAASGGDLQTLLAVFRERLQGTLDHKQIRLRWSMSDLQDAELGGERSLAVLRVVQEAVTNAIRHSRCENLSIETERLGGRDVRIEVADDGQGFDPGQSTGHGLGNMRVRAGQLGGRLDLESTAEGTVVRLESPIDPAT